MRQNNKDLFSPYQLGGVTLSNKIVMAPMTRGRANNDTHIPNEIQGTYYEQRASAGLIISEGIVVNSKAHGSVNIPAIYSEGQVNEWKKITNKVHAKGGKIFAQIWHVGRISHPALLGGSLPVAPSAINPNSSVFTFEGDKETVTPKELSIAEIIQIEEDFKQAAINAMEAGFDGVELHTANTYLFHQFMADSANKRTDNYGGSTENKARFLFETLDKVVSAIDAGKVGIRLSPHLNLAGIVNDAELEKVFEYIITESNRYNLAYLHLTGVGSTTQSEDAHPTEEIIESTRNYRSLYSGTIIINNGFDKTTAQQVIDENIADLVSFGTPFIANPDFVKRLRNNLELNIPTAGTFYESNGEKGYTDYPFNEE